ncbi:hypothetical protein [Entomobacter blattae]|uniref:Uncharacterized protein n=1 Tax=Entomobacter blattae TaxID=2762277 RepID=A0A7H1NRL0_9PROT|nr:hypothetical protein [Entomobacter blattae]QNT78420.1 hypothetical protein JGUZn3_11940 [Entomobacter blattae]QNT78423.1 hypothetical protein JGUZn3_11970 [Entomobacter blattae]
MKLITAKLKEDLFIFEATKEELEVCSKVTHLALDWLGDEFDARHQDTHESPYETGLELDKKLETLLEEHKDEDIITVKIRAFEAGIIYDAFNEVCNGIPFGRKTTPSLEQLTGYSREELKEFYNRYEKIFLYKFDT